MDDERLELAEWAYQGEVRGEVLFSALAAAQSDPDRRAQLETLCLLEEQTGELLRDLVARLGGSAAPSPQSRTRAQRTADEATKLSWEAFLESFGPITSAALAKYRRLRELVDRSDQQLLDDVVAHEEALQSFADAALAGAADPTARVVEQLRDPWRARVP